MSSRLRWAALAVGLVALLAAAPGASALLGLANPTPAPAATPVVVGYAPGELALATTLLASAGATPVESLDELDALVVAAPLGIESVRRLANATGAIRFVEPVLGTSASGAQWDAAQWDAAQWDGAQWDGAQWDGALADAAVTAGWQWGLHATQAPAAWPSEPTSSAASVCIADSGVNAHPDLPAPRATYNALAGGSTSVADEAGHGTHMAGIVAATRDATRGIAGVARAELLIAKVFDASGHGKDTDLARAIVWCARERADVLLLALSVDNDSQLLARALDHAAARHVIIVASAGNTGGAVTFPATHPRVIAVSAVDPSLAAPDFSSRGPSVTLAAPGTGILSTFGTDAYAYGSGTSQAAAFVAGAAAVLRAANPDLSPASARAALTAGARDVGAPGRDDATGAGLLDVPAALAAASWYG